MSYDELKDEMLEDKAYDSAKEIWDHIKIKNHGQFIDLDLKYDVLLLADCFERFTDVNIRHIKIYHCHCYSTPGLTWQAG
jgi:hypothetical protein